MRDVDPSEFCIVGGHRPANPHADDPVASGLWKWADRLSDHREYLIANGQGAKGIDIDFGAMVPHIKIAERPMCLEPDYFAKVSLLAMNGRHDDLKAIIDTVLSAAIQAWESMVAQPNAANARRYFESIDNSCAEMDLAADVIACRSSSDGESANPFEDGPPQLDEDAKCVLKTLDEQADPVTLQELSLAAGYDRKRTSRTVQLLRELGYCGPPTGKKQRVVIYTRGRTYVSLLDGESGA